jgi:hypothetical protein
LFEFVGQPVCLRPLQQVSRRKPTHDYVAWDEIRQDQVPLADRLAVTLFIRSLERNESGIEEVVGEQVTTEVVEVCDAL